MEGDDYFSNMALIYYIGDITTRFKRFDDKTIKELSQELSEVTLRIPVYFHTEQYKKGEFIRVFKDIDSKFFTACPENVCTITINGEQVKDKVTPLYLMGLFTYCVDRLSGGQVEDKFGFDYLKMGKMLSKDIHGGA